MAQREKRLEYLGNLQATDLIDLLMRAEARESENKAYDVQRSLFIDRVSDAIESAGGTGSDVGSPWDFIERLNKSRDHWLESYGREKERLTGFQEGVRAVLSAQAGMEN